MRIAVVRLFTVVVLFASLRANADQLLVILEAKTDSATLDWIAERGVQLYVKNKLNNKYRKTYFFLDSNPENSMSDILPTIIKQRNDNERLDVLAFQHGPKTTPFNGLFNREVEKIIPYGYVRHLYSSGCDNWGKIKFRGLDQIGSVSRYTLNKHLANLGVDSFIIYANVGTTTQHNLFTIIDNLSNPSLDWISAMLSSLQETDIMSISKLYNMSNNLPLSEWLIIDPRARPVFGFNQSVYSGVPVDVSALLKDAFEANGTSYVEVVLDMPQSLKGALKHLCGQLAKRNGSKKPFRDICQY